MPCKPCREKRIQEWIRRGKSKEWAEKHYDLVIAPKMEVFKRSLPIRIMQFLNRTNFKATLCWTFWLHEWVHIGKGHNPDYTQPCNPCTRIGDCAPLSECGIAADCREYFTCQRSCPAPLPNSTCTPNTCNCAQNGCSCVHEQCTNVPAPTCGAPAGQCDCNCNPGYVWDGVQCVLSAEARWDGFYFLDPG